MIDFIEKLDKKHKDYLQKEGKWLVGGFKDLFHTQNTEGKDLENMLKLEVFSMLPREIKNDILDFINK